MARWIECGKPTSLREHLRKLNAEVERHRADDLVERDQNAKLSRREDVDNHSPEARASALHVLSGDVAVAILVEAFGERALEHLTVGRGGGCQY